MEPAEQQMQPVEGPSADTLQLLRCTECRGGLARGAGGVGCAACGLTFPVDDGVVRFLGEHDPFYEGAYVRQIRYLPGGNPVKDWAYFHLVQSGVLGEIRRVLPTGGRILDIGCAGGIRWLGRDAVVVGLDLSLGSLRLAATTYGAAVQASALRLPLADGSMDVAYSSYVFEHLTSDQKLASLQEMRRVLRPHGAVVLQFDTLANTRLYQFAQRDPEAFRRAFIENDGHVGLAPLTQTLSLFELAGFRVQRCLKFGTTWLQYLATYRWLAAAYGAQVPWVRALARATEMVGSARLGTPYEFGVTAFDRTLSPIAHPDRATRAIVVARLAD